MDNVRYVKTGEGENVRFHQLGAVDNVRYVKTGEGENVRPVKKMRWQMTAYALIGEGENVRGGKCPVTMVCILCQNNYFLYFKWISCLSSAMDSEWTWYDLCLGLVLNVLNYQH